MPLDEAGEATRTFPVRLTRRGEYSEVISVSLRSERNGDNHAPRANFQAVLDRLAGRTAPPEGKSRGSGTPMNTRWPGPP